MCTKDGCTTTSNVRIRPAKASEDSSQAVPLIGKGPTPGLGEIPIRRVRWSCLACGAESRIRSCRFTHYLVCSPRDHWLSDPRTDPSQPIFKLAKAPGIDGSDTISSGFLAETLLVHG